jgi:hypothetical protein
MRGPGLCRGDRGPENQEEEKAEHAAIIHGA